MPGHNGCSQASPVSCRSSSEKGFSQDAGASDKAVKGTGPYTNEFRCQAHSIILCVFSLLWLLEESPGNRASVFFLLAGVLRDPVQCGRGTVGGPGCKTLPDSPLCRLRLLSKHRRILLRYQAEPSTVFPSPWEWLVFLLFLL